MTHWLDRGVDGWRLDAAYAVPASFWAAVLPAVCATLPLAAQAAAPITAGSITNSPPMISYASDGTTLQGVIVDLAAAMSKQMGREIVFKAMPFSGLLPAMQAKRIHISFTLMNDTPAREKLVDFVDFFNLGTMLLIKKGNPQHVQSLETMCGMTVSTVQGSTQLALVDEMSAKCAAAGKPKVDVKKYPSGADTYLALQAGRVDTSGIDYAIAAHQVESSDGKLELAGELFAEGFHGAALAKDNTQLRDALLKAFQSIYEQGATQKILAKWGVPQMAIQAPVVNAMAAKK